MKRRLPFAVLFAISLALVSLLPLYVEQTMTRVMFADGRGEAIEWGWKLCTLRTFFSDYRYFPPPSASRALDHYERRAGFKLCLNSDSRRKQCTPP